MQQKSILGQGQSSPEPAAAETSVPAPATAPVQARETGGRDGPEPTRYGDWEKNGRCIDF